MKLVENPIEKRTYYFTFGIGQKLGGFCQPILASSEKIAREKMQEIHGIRYAFQYTENEYLKLSEQGLVTHTLLESVEAE